MASVTQVRRLFTLLQKLQSESSYNARQLAEELGVSRRTMFRDLRSLEKLGVKAEFDERAQRYRVTMPEELAQQAELSPTQLESLLAFRESPSTPTIRNGNAALLATQFGLPAANRLAPECSNCRQKIVEALLQCRFIELSKPGSSVERFQPIKVVHTLGRWYLIARHVVSERVEPIAVRELRTVALTEDRFEKLSETEVERLTNLAWQGVNNGHTREAVIRLSAAAADRAVHDKHLPVQDVEWRDDGGATIRTSIDGDELLEWVLSFGREAELLEPAAMRSEISKHWAALQRQYSDQVV